MLPATNPFPGLRQLVHMGSEQVDPLVDSDLGVEPAVLGGLPNQNQMLQLVGNVPHAMPCEQLASR